MNRGVARIRRGRGRASIAPLTTFLISIGLGGISLLVYDGLFEQVRNTPQIVEVQTRVSPTPVSPPPPDGQVGNPYAASRSVPARNSQSRRAASSNRMMVPSTGQVETPGRDQDPPRWFIVKEDRSRRTYIYYQLQRDRDAEYTPGR